MIYEKKEDLIKALTDVIGDNNDQTALDLIANVSDTYDSLDTGLSSQLSDMTTKYNNLAKDYKERFLSGGTKKEPEEKKKPEIKTLTQMLKGD